MIVAFYVRSTGPFVRIPGKRFNEQNAYTSPIMLADIGIIFKRFRVTANKFAWRVCRDIATRFLSRVIIASSPRYRVTAIKAIKVSIIHHRRVIPLNDGFPLIAPGAMRVSPETSVSIFRRPIDPYLART